MAPRPPVGASLVYPVASRHCPNDLLEWYVSSSVFNRCVHYRSRNANPDYGESHYIGPIKGAQPNSEAWVDGFDHTPWLSLNAYFARAFKEGCFPPIEGFRVYVWARPHKKDAEARADEVGRPRGWELVRFVTLHIYSWWILFRLYVG